MYKNSPLKILQKLISGEKYRFNFTEIVILVLFEYFRFKWPKIK